MLLADVPFHGHVFGYPVRSLTDIWCAGLAILVAALLISFRLQRGSTRILAGYCAISDIRAIRGYLSASKSPPPTWLMLRSVCSVKCSGG